MSYFAGDAQIGVNVTPLDPSSVASEVWYGKKSGKYSMKRTGISTIYNQNYPFQGLLNYTSGIIHHVKIDGEFFYVKCISLNNFVWLISLFYYGERDQCVKLQ